MQKKLLVTKISILLFFTACGSSNNSTNTNSSLSVNNFKTKDYLIMGHNTAVAECNTNFINQNIQGAFFGDIFEYSRNIDKSSVIVLLKNGTIPCTDYGRVDDIAGNCDELDLAEGTEKTCIVGLNLVK